MLINFSNHPSDLWGEQQRREAEKRYGSIVDIPFPAVDPQTDEKEVLDLAEDYFEQVTAPLNSCAAEPKPHAVHIQGEFTLVFALVTMLKASGITCLASTTRRVVEEQPDGTKVSHFDFIRFREYVFPDLFQNNRE